MDDFRYHKIPITDIGWSTYACIRVEVNFAGKFFKDYPQKENVPHVGFILQ